MFKLYYCLDCRRIFSAEEECTYCKSKSTKVLARNSPVNVIGSKLKGKVISTGQNIARILFVDENRNRSIKEYEAAKIRKIL